MKYFVISYQDCVGCGACVEVCPELFELIGDKAWIKLSDKVIQ